MIINNPVESYKKIKFGKMHGHYQDYIIIRSDFVNSVGYQLRVEVCEDGYYISTNRYILPVLTTSEKTLEIIERISNMIQNPNITNSYAAERFIRDLISEIECRYIIDTDKSDDLNNKYNKSIFDYSFMGKSDITKNEAIDIVTNTDRPIVYTYGLEYRNPTTYRKLITKEKALDIISKEGYTDIRGTETEIRLNVYSSNDLW